ALFAGLYQRHALLRLGRRRSRCLMTAQGAAANNAVRDGAPRGARALRRGPRATGPPPPSSDFGSRKLGVQAARSQGRPKGADRKAAWAPPGAPFLSYGEERKTGRRAHLGVRTTKSRDSGALAE